MRRYPQRKSYRKRAIDHLSLLTVEHGQWPEVKKALASTLEGWLSKHVIHEPERETARKAYIRVCEEAEREAQRIAERNKTIGTYRKPLSDLY